VIIGWRQGKIRRQRPTLLHLGLALLVAAFLVYPWLVFGALGSPMDTLLNLAAGLLFGLAVALIIVYFLLPALQATSNGRGWDLMLAGFVIGALLVMMVSALGFNGMQLLLLFALPGVGWAAAALGYPAQHETGSRLLAVTFFLGLATAAPALFIDPDEFALILGLGGRDLLTWAFWAAMIAMLVSWIVSLFAFLWRARWAWRPPLAFVGAGAGIFLLAGLLLYFFAGHPGFHGEQLFVILGDQADLSAAESMTDYDARRQFAYETLVNHADSTQADIRDNLDSLNIAYTPYYLVNAIAVDGGPLLRLWLESRPEVDRVLDNPILRPLPAQAETASGTITITQSLLPLWNQTLIGADQVWAEFDVTGQGIVIGQSDSGVQGDHPELINSYRGRESGHDYNWLDPWNATTKPADIGGHGTHTLGSIVGQNTGVAPGAEWFGCVTLARNLANPALYLDCMQFMLAPYPLGGDPFTDGDPTRSAHVLNNSWGCPPLEGCDPNSLQPAVRALRAAGIFVVVSAGNEGTANCETVSHPLSLYDEVFSVGAISEFGELADFSSLGPVTADGSGRVKPDIVAPGVNILSAFPNSTYEYLDGTSMAGPHVAGVVALIWSANPELIGQIARTEEILIATTQSYTGTLNSCVDGTRIPNNGVGYGVVDAYAAVEMAIGLTP
jgi:subtilisin family serine protease